MSYYTDIAVPACLVAGAPEDQKRPAEMGCRFEGDTEEPPPNPATRCGADWPDANSKCGDLCTDNGGCTGQETCFAHLDVGPCA